MKYQVISMNNEMVYISEGVYLLLQTQGVTRG